MINNSKEFICINKTKILNAPTKEPKSIFTNLTLRLRSNEVAVNKRKSKRKLIKKMTSRYTFIASPI